VPLQIRVWCVEASKRVAYYETGHQAARNFVTNLNIEIRLHELSPCQYICRHPKICPTPHRVHGYSNGRPRNASYCLASTMTTVNGTLWTRRLRLVGVCAHLALTGSYCQFFGPPTIIAPPFYKATGEENYGSCTASLDQLCFVSKMWLGPGSRLLYHDVNIEDISARG
jgi:hypothetical protein